MYTRLTALSDASPALRSLFAALIEQREVDERWAQGQIVNDPEMTPEIVAQVLQLSRWTQFTIAGCIVVTANAVLKSCAIAVFGEANGRSRIHYGTRNGVTFGAALLAVANAFRHHDEWSPEHPPHPNTADVLDQLGVARDITACLDTLDHFQIRTVEHLTREIDIAVDQMENGAVCECGHPASYHTIQPREENPLDDDGCRFLTHVLPVNPLLPGLSNFARCACLRSKREILNRP